jgi:hypothetical protein
MYAGAPSFNSRNKTSHEVTPLFAKPDTVRAWFCFPNSTGSFVLGLLND